MSLLKKKKKYHIKIIKGGFYVYAEPKKFKNLKDGIEYVTRYCGRVPISENRIINYNGKNVTFSYEAHEDGTYHEVTVDAKEFIMILLRHLIPHNFKIIRYYGFYRKRHSFYDKLVLLVSKLTRQIRKSLLKHELSVLKSFNEILIIVLNAILDSTTLLT